MFRLADDKELTLDLLGEFLIKHNKEVTDRYKILKEAYETDYPIFKQKKKPEFKPDNRIAANFAKYIVDNFEGFFMGIPVKVTCDDKEVTKYVELLDQYNDQDDNNAELSKICSIFGKGYEMYFVDDAGNICITYLSPMDAFMIYDESIVERPRYFVRKYVDTENILHGSVSDGTHVKYFIQKGELKWDEDEEEKKHGFDGVPATEYRQNREEIGIFEPVMSLINAYNKAISEKANDVDYFADAYLKVLGAKLTEEGMRDIRSNRIINFDGNYDGKLVVEFLDKPEGDTTQENLIDRLEKLIFQISMTANISDENFGTSTGIALKYKLLAMSNLGKTKERKFTSGMNRRYMLIASNPISKMKKDDWVKLNYQFTQNFPANLLEESQIAGNLSGVTSKQTQLKVLSVVDNVQDEIDRMAEDADKEGYDTDFPTNRTVIEEDELLEEQAGTA